ncbi:MAG: peptide deformylase [Armatimonadota bacterium]|nr:peptide deformylase [Armatimonadota bacterium]MDR5689517.1 peptide deformylase [Armatimonadota bacterium]MDR7389200.1 peptide deformylase [Armatimonadota bacterium]MDR7391993.1 peptide deformylase [Armatimonadota bacterium]MDR7396506.1 peptide deformylase [Armatimonadota bacterium]
MRIVTLDGPGGAILRRRARPVGRLTAEVVRLMDEMVEVMRRASGVGLAAPQVGYSLRVIVVEYDNKLYQLVDPEITSREGEEVAQEGCLSLPGILCDVRRATRVTVRGKNRRGRTVTVRADGWLARIFQHEVDHLDGILITDRVESPADIHYVDRERAVGEVVG